MATLRWLRQVIRTLRWGRDFIRKLRWKRWVIFEQGGSAQGKLIADVIPTGWSAGTSATRTTVVQTFTGNPTGFQGSNVRNDIVQFLFQVRCALGESVTPANDFTTNFFYKTESITVNRNGGGWAGCGINTPNSHQSIQRLNNLRVTHFAYVKDGRWRVVKLNPATTGTTSSPQIVLNANQANAYIVDTTFGDGVFGSAGQGRPESEIQPLSRTWINRIPTSSAQVWGNPTQYYTGYGEATAAWILLRCGLGLSQAQITAIGNYCYVKETSLGNVASMTTWTCSPAVSHTWNSGPATRITHIAFPQSGRFKVYKIASERNYIDSEKTSAYIEDPTFGDGAFGTSAATPPTIQTFTATPAFVDQDNLPAVGSRNIVFRWLIVSDTDVDVKFFTPDGPVTFAGNQNKAGSISQTFPDNETDYSLQVSNSGGTVNRHITVPVYDDPIIHSLTTGSIITSPFGYSNVLISWRVTGKPYPTLEIDYGTGQGWQQLSSRHYNTGTGVGSIRHTYTAHGNRIARLRATNHQQNNTQSQVTRATAQFAV